MNHLAKLIIRGENYFGSGSYTTKQFDEFFEDFKKSFTYQLKKLKAKEIEFSKGHFYLSGFFKVGEQFYYFSIGDVRHGFDCVMQWDGNYKVKMLIRTAEHNKDYTGGMNRHVFIENGMAKEIARVFGLEVKTYKAKKKTNKELAMEAIEKGELRRSMSMKQANFVAFRVMDYFGVKGGISVAKRGRWNVYAKVDCEQFYYYYDGYSGRMVIQVHESMTDEKFIAQLKLRDEPETVTNPFSGESCELEPLAVALHDFIKGCEVTNNYLNFDRALSIFRQRWPEEYMILLD